MAEFTLDILPMKTEYYFYILECRNKTKYYGYTNNLANRLADHASGYVISTKDKRPVSLVYFEIFNSRLEALKREIQFKNGKTRKKTIEKLISLFPKAKCQGFNSHVHRRNFKGDGLTKIKDFRKPSAH